MKTTKLTPDKAKTIVQKERDKLTAMRQEQKKLEDKIQKQHKKIRQAEANVILSLPEGSIVHYDRYLMDSRLMDSLIQAYPCVFAWISERTGKIHKTGRKYVWVDFGEKGILKILASSLKEGEGKRESGFANAVGKMGDTVNTFLQKEMQKKP